jgi:hypothetical protein
LPADSLAAVDLIRACRRGDDHDHLITAEDRIRVAMTRQ